MAIYLTARPRRNAHDLEARIAGALQVPEKSAALAAVVQVAGRHHRSTDLGSRRAAASERRSVLADDAHVDTGHRLPARGTNLARGVGLGGPRHRPVAPPRDCPVDAAAEHRWRAGIGKVRGSVASASRDTGYTSRSGTSRRGRGGYRTRHGARLRVRAGNARRSDDRLSLQTTFGLGAEAEDVYRSDFSPPPPPGVIAWTR